MGHPAERGLPLPGGPELRAPRVGVGSGVVRLHVQRSGRRSRQLRDRQPDALVIFATPYNAYRQDNISVVDLRVEKTVPLGRQAKVRLFLDGFNLANAYAAETIAQPRRRRTSSSRPRFSDRGRRASASV